MLSQLDALGERLLRAGVDRGAVRRYIRELDDHFRDLAAEETALYPKDDAMTRALMRLGSFDALSEAMIAKTEFRAWSARSPLVVFVIAPALFLGLAFAAAIVFLMVVVKVSATHGGAHPVPPMWFGNLVEATKVATSDIVPLLLGWAVAAIGLGQRSKRFWPIIGMVAIALLGLGGKLDVVLPTPAGGHGELNIAFGLGPSPSALVLGALHGAANMVAIIAPYLVFERRLSLR